jgi:hypothetical protein
LDAQILGGPVLNPANGHVYCILQPNTWTGSEAQAVALGGHLATSRSAAENQWVLNTFGAWTGTNLLWIGLNDIGSNGTFYWVSGETASYLASPTRRLGSWRIGYGLPWDRHRRQGACSRTAHRRRPPLLPRQPALISLRLWLLGVGCWMFQVRCRLYTVVHTDGAISPRSLGEDVLPKRGAGFQFCCIADIHVQCR